MLVLVSPFALGGFVYLSTLEGLRGGYEKYLFLLAISFFGAVFVTPLVRAFAFKVEALDVPDAKRKTHRAPTALLGGVGVYVVFVGTCFLMTVVSREMKGIFLASALILAVGVTDDVFGGLSSKIRLGVQLLATVIVISFGVHLDFYPHTVWGRALSCVLTVVWIVGLTNSMNYLDGMDGLATGLAAISAGMFLIISYSTNRASVSFVSAALCGACAGFLVHNFRPAAIFLGDAGSTTLGFLLACIGVIGDWSNGNPIVSFGVPVIVLGIPIFDMVYTTVERVATGKVSSVGEWLSYAGKDHFHHRILGIGLEVQHAVLFIYFVQITLGISAVVIARSDMVRMLLLLCQAAFMFMIITVLMVFGQKKS